MRVYVYAREKCLMSNLFPSHACVASIKGSATPNMLFMDSKNGGGVEGVGKKNENQGDFFYLNSCLLLQKNLSLQSKLSKIGI